MRFTSVFPFVFALTLLWTGESLFAQESPFTSGVAALQKGDAKAAASDFQKALELNPDQPVTLFNLGLAEQRLGRNGMALALWRKALALSPEFQPAIHAIAWTSKRLEKPELAREVEFWESLRATALIHVSLTTYIVFSFVLLFVFGWTLLSYLGKRRRALLDETSLPAYPWIATVFGVLFVVFALLTGAKMIDLQDIRGTIIAKKVEARSAPDAGATILFELFEGLEVIVRQTSNDWAQVTYPGGSTGWVPREMLFTTTQRVGP